MNINNTLYTLNTNIFNDNTLQQDVYNHIPQERREKIDRFRFEKDKRLSLGAGYLLQKALEEAGITDYHIEYRGRQKPYVAGRSDVFFNISHSGEMVALALSDKEVGVDIEKEQHFKENLIDYVFTQGDKALAKELTALLGITIDQAYTRLWTVKESVMKYSGLGIALAPKSILLSKAPISNNPGRFISASSESFDCKKLMLCSYSIPGYQLTVCSDHGSFKVIQGAVALDEPLPVK